VIDEIIYTTAEEAKRKNRHLLRSRTILMRFSRRVDLEDEDDIRQRLLEAAAKDLINSRFNALGYYSVRNGNKCGFFVNIDECRNISYLKAILSNYLKTQEGWERQTEEKIRRRISEIRGLKLDGQTCFDEDMNIFIPMNEDEFYESLEADAV